MISHTWKALAYIWATLGNLLAWPVVWILRRLGNRVDLDTWEVHGPTATWFYDHYWGGVTLSRDVTLVWIKAPEYDWTALPELLAHESRHRWQAAILGPLYLPIYGLIFLALSAWHRSWAEGYARHPLERDACAYTARTLVGQGSGSQD